MTKLSLYNLNIYLLFLPSIFTAFVPGKIVLITSICFYPIFIYLLFNYLKSKNIGQDGKLLISLFILFNAVIFFRGLFDIVSYQDVIVTFSTMIFVTLMFPLYITNINSHSFVPIFRSIVWVAIPLSSITFFYPPTNGFMSYQHNISIVYLLIFFIPYVKRKVVIFIIFLAISGLIYDLTRRSYSVNLGISALILIISFIKNPFLLKNIGRFVFIFFSIAPLIFLYLGLSGTFNIFKIGELYEGVTIESNNNTRNALVDSRTSIYQDVFGELSKNKSFLLGLGGNGKTETSLIELQYSDYDIIYKEGRRSTESGMLNYIQWGGVITAFFYWLLLVFGSYKAIFLSNNKFIFMCGLFLSFKIFYSFIEDAVQINISSFYLMLLIGMCYNLSLRGANSTDLKYYMNLIFKK